MKNITPYLAFASFVLFLLLGCVTSDVMTTYQSKYEKLEVANNAIKDVVEPGMNISIETNYAVIRCMVTGYESEKILVCVDKYNAKELKVSVKDINEIQIEVPEERPVKERVTYTNEGNLSKQLIYSLITYPRVYPVYTKPKLIAFKSDSQKQLEHFIQDNYDGITKEAKSGCGEKIDLFYGEFIKFTDALYSEHISTNPYIENIYDKLTNDLFCTVLQKDFGVLFEYDDLFLSTLVDRIKTVVSSSGFDRYFAFENDCDDIGNIIKEKEDEGIESFAITCSDGIKEFQCDFQEKIAYDGKGIPYKKANMLYVVDGRLVKFHKLQPACWRSEPLSIVRRLAIQNGCNDAGEVTKTKQERNIESFVVNCTDRIIEFQCDFQGEVDLSNDGLPVKNVYGKSYKVQPACWLSE